MPTVWTKICGVRDVTAATAVAELGPSAIGLNFYPKSPRCVDTTVAAEIVSQLPATTEAVGVFVNATAERVADVVTQIGLHRIQLHGDEPPEFLAEIQRRCPQTPLIRAWRMSDTGLADLASYLARCDDLGVTISACLVDAHVAGSYGGTGAVVQWELLRDSYRTDQWPPLVLAGGLRPGNVAAAIRAMQPWGVDVASGVESAPGVKDLALVEQFLAVARSQ
ncbi:MAG TPA: phosphoribosylanthranilate isomerase [Planctomycetaceae bacterium]|nr:phosphoribosylanthranilate isomerase [Planctomycetaceae bacterium]